MIRSCLLVAVMLLSACAAVEPAPVVYTAPPVYHPAPPVMIVPVRRCWSERVWDHALHRHVILQRCG